VKRNEHIHLGHRFRPEPAVRPQDWRFNKCEMRKEIVAPGTGNEFRGLKDIKRRHSLRGFKPSPNGSGCRMQLILKRSDLLEGARFENKYLRDGLCRNGVCGMSCPKWS
jgi:hypothetical protein